MHRLLTAIAALLLLSIAGPILASDSTAVNIDSAAAYLTTGVRWNQGHPAGMIGITKRLGPRVTVYVGGDLEGIQRAASAQAMFQFMKIGPVFIHALLGPQAETIQPNPDAEHTLTYITGATGFLADCHLNNQLGVWTGFEYLITDANIKQWKFAIGLYAPIHL